MADGDNELEMEEGGKKKGKMMIIIIAVVVLAVGGAAAWFFLGGSNEPVAEQAAGGAAPAPSGGSLTGPNVGSALYVAMPRPFIFNVPGAGRDRLVQIKVQLMVRGTDNEEQAKMHIPRIEGTLLKVFSSSNADDLVTEVGKMAMRDQALREVQKALREITGQEIIEQVLFTGFVMQ